ncbi:MAG: hypothetical protein HRT57_11015, partial [Crocinitomicaceae bacterium]|nr:hypothetical protein [Crocinitomicaceae bacterium]
MSIQTTQNKHALGKIRAWKSPVDLSTNVEVTFYLRQNQSEGAGQNIMQHPVKRQYIQGKEFNKSFTTDSPGMESLNAFLKEYNIKISEENSTEQIVIASGNIEEFTSAFKVAFSMYQTPEGQEYLSYQGVLAIPVDLQPYIISISGLEKGLIKGMRSPVVPELVHHDVDKGYSPQDIADFYNFPSNDADADADGECIGLVELGGNYKMSDIKQYCELFGLSVPEIVEVGTKPTVPASSQMVDDLEVSLDIQMVAGLAPKAKIVIYYASSIPDAMHLAIHDTANNPSVLSVSWAVSESDSSVADRELIDQLCYQASLKGITVVAASGDHGAYNGKSFPNVMLPASNPFVLGCGGTTLYISKDYEQVWNSGTGLGSGGGYSAIYPIPEYQQNAIDGYKKSFPYGNNGRGVPDISANSSPETAYTIVMNGKVMSIGAGTSASTPVWASLITILNKSLGYRLG